MTTYKYLKMICASTEDAKVAFELISKEPEKLYDILRIVILSGITDNQPTEAAEFGGVQNIWDRFWTSHTSLEPECSAELAFLLEKIKKDHVEQREL